MKCSQAMTVGDTSNFLDIALNFGSSQIKYDNIVTQMKRKGLKVVFYGDDTWIKLFPHSFYRDEGVPSFFVSDFHEVRLKMFLVIEDVTCITIRIFHQVDDIVTKNVEHELTRDDWDVMILHYLGMDNIGHVEGPTSWTIHMKLREMDAVIEKIHNYLLKGVRIRS